MSLSGQTQETPQIKAEQKSASSMQTFKHCRPAIWQYQSRLHLRFYREICNHLLMTVGIYIHPY